MVRASLRCFCRCASVNEVGERVFVYFCNCPVQEIDPDAGASVSIPLDILTTLQDCTEK